MTFAFYHDVVFKTSPLAEAELQRRSLDLMAVTRRVFPELVTEIEAIAKAAELDPWCVFLLNARTEVLNARVGECTSMVVPETRIMAQTWDWIRELEDLVVITEVETDTGHRFVALVEPGMLAKIGMNSRGLGVGLNFLKAEHALDGVPVHLVLRALGWIVPIWPKRARLWRGRVLGRRVSFPWAPQQARLWGSNLPRAGWPS